MLNLTFKKVSQELEELVKFDITLERAIDLLEATTQNIEELVVINTIRETLAEMRDTIHNNAIDYIVSSNPAATQSDSDMYHA